MTNLRAVLIEENSWYS